MGGGRAIDTPSHYGQFSLPNSRAVAARVIGCAQRLQPLVSQPSEGERNSSDGQPFGVATGPVTLPP
jgi:hypothetical protein